MQISPNDGFTLFAVLCLIIAISSHLEKTRWGAKISGPGLVIAISIAATHAAILPRQAPLYDLIWQIFVPLAIALFLLKADLIGIYQKGGRVLIAFILGALGASVGAVLGGYALDLGANENKLIAVFAATYTGGSLNFAATAEAVDFKQSSELSAALAVDNVIGTLYIILTIWLGGWAVLKRRFHWGAETADNAGTDNGESHSPPTLSDLLTMLALAAVACVIGIKFADYLGLDSFAVLFITVIAVGAATIGRNRLRSFKGEDILAMILLYMFFAVVGAGSDISEMLSTPPATFLLVGSIIGTHFLFLFVGGYLLKLNYRELIIASLACISGPPVAAAIAVSFGWREHILPGIATGVLGYVVGTFIGVGLFHMLG
nr:DUF819 family protein [Pacificimonas pallii]